MTPPSTEFLDPLLPFMNFTFRHSYFTKNPSLNFLEFTRDSPLIQFTSLIKQLGLTAQCVVAQST